jgi:hypothetical protein
MARVLTGGATKIAGLVMNGQVLKKALDAKELHRASRWGKQGGLQGDHVRSSDKQQRHRSRPQQPDQR